MSKNIHFFSAPGVRYAALECFAVILEYFINEYENDSRMKEEISLARSLFEFIKSDNQEYYNA